MANIAFGGELSINTMIVDNLIAGSNKEGIFMIESGQCVISRNQITRNIDGIVVVIGIPFIANNEISKNKSNGIVSMQRSSPILQGNIIKENQGVGLFIKDTAHVKLKGNNEILGNGLADVLKGKEAKLDECFETEVKSKLGKVESNAVMSCRLI